MSFNFKHALFKNVIYLILATNLLGGCRLEDRKPLTPTSPNPGSSTDTSPPQLEYPQGWSELIIISRYAKTVIDIAGHFLISRNACLKEESGAIPLEDWNILAKTLNESIKLEPPRDGICFSSPDAPYGLDGTVDILLATKEKKPLYEVRGYKTCTFIKERALYEPLLGTLNRILKTAMLESCPVELDYF